MEAMVASKVADGPTVKYDFFTLRLPGPWVEQYWILLANISVW